MISRYFNWGFVLADDMGVLEEILEFLNDSDGRNLKEIRNEIGLEEGKLRKVLSLLDEVDFLDFNREEGSVKINRLGSKILNLPEENEVK